MDLSLETKHRLIRYRNAVDRKREETRVVDHHPLFGTSTQTSAESMQEWVAAREDLQHCPEPEIKALAHRMQSERLDETDNTLETAKDMTEAGHRLYDLGRECAEEIT